MSLFDRVVLGEGDGDVVGRARALAKKAHAGQIRKYSHTSYAEHPIRVSRLLQKAGASDAVVAAGALHDVVEDTPLTVGDVRAQFGDEVAGLVGEVTDRYTKTDYPDLNRRSRKKLEFERHAQATIGGKLIKLADRLDNLMSVDVAAADEKDFKFLRKTWLPESRTLLSKIGSAHAGMATKALARLDRLQAEVEARAKGPSR